MNMGNVSMCVYKLGKVNGNRVIGHIGQVNKRPPVHSFLKGDLNHFLYIQVKK